MFLELMATFACGFALMGVVLILNRAFGQKLGRWVYTGAMATGMIGFSVWSEYTWANRTISALTQLQLATETSESVFYRPWTFAFPQVTRMIAIDLSQTRTHPGQPDLVLTRVVLMARWQPMHAYLAVFDCAQNTRADLFEGVELNADGTLNGAAWVALDADDPVLASACAARAQGGGDEPRDNT